MNLEELLTLSLKAIWGNKLRSFLTTLGITIGVFAIIVLVSIGSGLQSYITNEISSLGSNVIFVIPGSSGGIGAILSNKLTLQNSQDLQRRLASIGKVTPEIRQVEIFKYKNIKRIYKYWDFHFLVRKWRPWPSYFSKLTFIKIV